MIPSVPPSLPSFPRFIHGIFIILYTLLLFKKFWHPLLLLLCPYRRLDYPSSSVLPLLQGPFCTLPSDSLSHTFGTRCVLLFKHIVLCVMSSSRPGILNLGFINGIWEPPATAPNSVCVHVCALLFCRGAGLIELTGPFQYIGGS